MKPGRELDALIAEKVMGWKWDETSAWSDHAGRWDNSGIHKWGWLPFYSTYIAAAWEVVEKLQAEPGGITGMGRRFALESQRYGDGLLFEATFEPSNPNERYTALTAPHAICLAALKAVEAWK